MQWALSQVPDYRSDVDCPISSFIEFSTRVYLSHLPLNKLIIRKQNNLN